MNKRIKKKLESRNGFMKYKNQHRLVTKRRQCPITGRWFNFKSMPKIFWAQFAEKTRQKIKFKNELLKKATPLIIINEPRDLPDELLEAFYEHEKQKQIMGTSHILIEGPPIKAKPINDFFEMTPEGNVKFKKSGLYQVGNSELKR